MNTTLLPKPAPCRGCTGFNWNSGFGFTRFEGSGTWPLLVVAEAPGANEEEEGRPLSPNGASGKVFRRALRDMGVPAGSLTITNVLRCRPPDNELRGQPYAREVLDHCARYLNRTVSTAAPRAIIALGDVPLREMLDDSARIAMGGTVTTLRGFVLPSRWEGIPLISTYHPAYVARGAWHLYGAFRHDLAFAARCAVRGVPAELERNYALQPSLDTVAAYIAQLRSNPTHPVSYDVETAHILGEVEPDDWRLKRIVQIQFSSAAGHAIVLPLDTDEQRQAFAPHTQRILALPNPKWSWNGRLSDDLVLEHGLSWTINGERHDLMNAWGHLQPSYWGGKDDKDTDKGVPSRLMGLQSCASFYCPEVGPWKHLSGDLPLYGAYDADYTTRVGVGIMESLEEQGLMAGYRSHKLDLRPVLDDLGEIGLPVDRDGQTKLRVYVAEELQRLQTEIQALIPEGLTAIHPKAGYKALHSQIAYAADPEVKIALRDILANYDPSEPPLVTAAGHVGYLVYRLFPADEPLVVRKDRGDGITITAHGGYVNRPCIQRLYNPHGSSPNTKAYIRAMGYRMPRALDSGEETTAKLELQKLADETGDPVLKLTQDWREFAQVANNYSGGYWIPGEDGRVHAEFRWGTASAQLVAVRPPVMTYPEHNELAKRVKEVICAQPGHMLVKIDKRGFHARMTGWLARDPTYYRIADFDVHSFVTAGFLGLPDAPYLMDMDDDELAGALAAIKHEHHHTRNYKVKRVVHGVTFGAKVKKIYGMYGPNFDPKPEELIAEVGEARWYDWDPDRQRKEVAYRGRRTAQGLIDTLASQFPRTFSVFPEWVRNQIVNVTPCKLVSAFGHHRYFYDYDMEQATAFLPSNCSHCDFQAALVRMHRTRVLQHFEAINITHDALWLHPHTRDVRDCIAEVQYEFDKPSDVLTDNPLGAFQCNSDAEVGSDLAHMDEWKG